MDDRPLLVRVLEAARRDLQGTDRTDLHAAASRCLFDALTCIAAGGTTEATTPSELASPRIGLDRTGDFLGRSPSTQWPPMTRISTTCIGRA